MELGPLTEAELRPLTVEDVQTLKRDLETQISVLLYKFTRASQMTVEYVNVEPVRAFEHGPPSRYVVTLDVKL